MAKRPGFYLYAGDYLRDSALAKCSPATRGIWVDMLCHMCECSPRGILSGTPAELARACRCSLDEMMTAIDELDRHNAADVTCNADVTQGNTIVTLCNRRMVREDKVRHDTRLRVQRYREKRKCNADATNPPSPPYSPPQNGGDRFITKTEREGFST